MNFKLQSGRTLMASLWLLISLASTAKGAGAFENYLAQRYDRYRYDWDGNDRDRYDRYQYDWDGNAPYRYNGRGEFSDGERDYRCDALIVDFAAPRARIKCDSFQLTLQKGRNRDRNSMEFSVLQVDEQRYSGDRYDAEISCELNGESQERLNRFSCEGVYRDRDDRSRRFWVNFAAYSQGKPLTGY